MKLDEIPTGNITYENGITWTVYDKEADLGSPLPYSTAHCTLCGKPFKVPLYTGIYDPVCGDCFKMYLDTAKVVCATCGAVVGRVIPGIKDCGYTVKPKELLHTSKCSICHPNITQSIILEIDNWIKYVREPVIYSPSGTLIKSPIKRKLIDKT